MDSGECDGWVCEELYEGGYHHQRQRSRSQQRLFYKYCIANTVIARTVDLSIRAEATSIRARDTGDDGHRLLEFGNYYDLSWIKERVEQSTACPFHPKLHTAEV